MEYAILFAFAITVAAVLTIVEGRKDRRRQALGLRFRTSDSQIDISETLRIEQPSGVFSHGRTRHSNNAGHHGSCGNPSIRRRHRRAGDDPALEVFQ